MTRPPADLSVLTLARGRADHLANLVRGLCRQTVLPRELVIAVMQDELYDDLPDSPFPIRQIRVTAETLPLSLARNRAADAACGEVLVFLDVDCIPSPTLVIDYLRAARPGAGLMMGEVVYLPAGATDGDWSTGAFDRIGSRHSDRQGPPPEGLRRCEDYRCFWSLNFAMHASDWVASGGFDTRFEGYGGEDTDFARSLQEREVAIWWMRGARVYHQHHDHFMPPIHSVASILRNTEIFASKWGHRTMEHWIHAFRMMGLIEVASDGFRILREPGAEDYALCRQTPDMPYAATARVIRALEDRAALRAGIRPEAANAPGRHDRMVAAQSRLVRADVSAAE